MTPRTLLAPMLIAVPILAAPAGRACSLCPIDDFESGSLYEQASTFEQHTFPIPAYSSHSVAPQRTVTLEPTGGYLMEVELNAGLTVDDYLEITNESGDCRVEWDWGFPVDLTAGGAVDCIDLQVEGSENSTILLHIHDATGSTSVARQLAGGGTELISWDLATFLQSALVDITQATKIVLHFKLSLDGEPYRAYDLRFGKAATGPVDFVPNILATAFPPLPSPPLQFELYEWGTQSPIYEANVRVTGAMTDAQTVPTADWTLTESAATVGDVAQMSLLWTDFGGIMETEFDFEVQVASLGSPGVDLYPPDPIHTPESIALSFAVVPRSAQGQALGVSNTWVTFDFDERQLGSLEFWDVNVIQGPAAAAWTDRFTLHFRMAFSGMNSADEVFPLFHATWMSDWSQAVPTGVRPAAPADGPLRLVAAPSVTRGSTEIRASRPFERATTLLIHDVAGRRIRSLPVSGGAVAVPWDGRTDGGRPAAAGVYFVRTADGAGSVTRIVKAGVR